MARKRGNGPRVVVRPAPTPAVLDTPPVSAAQTQSEPPPVVINTPMIVRQQADVLYISTDSCLDFARRGGSFNRVQSLLMSLLCRHANGPASDGSAGQMQQYLSLTFGGRSGGADYAPAVDKWTTPDGKTILAFRCENYKEDTIKGLQTGHRPRVVPWPASGWDDALAVDSLLSFATANYALAAPLIDQSKYANSPQYILTGHGAGGVAAYAAAVLANKAAKAINPANAGPVAGVVTFGEWPFLSASSYNPTRAAVNLGFRHVRVRFYSDPVFDLMQTAVAVGEAQLASFVDGRIAGDATSRLPGYDPADVEDDLSTFDSKTSDYLPWSRILRFVPKPAFIGLTAVETYTQALPGGADAFGRSLLSLPAEALAEEGSFSATNYSRAVESICRSGANTPYPFFTFLVEASRYLDGVTKR